jgi:hypothetical protein
VSKDPPTTSPTPPRPLDHVSAPLILWILTTATIAFAAAAVAPEGWRRVVAFVLAVLAAVLGPVASSRVQRRQKVSGIVLTVLLLVAAGGISVLPSAQLPFTVEVETGTPRDASGYCDAFKLDDDATPFNVPEPTENLANLSRDGEQAWIKQTSAKDAGRTQLEIRLQGRAADAVILNQPKVVLESSDEASTTTVFYYETECGSGFAHRYYKVDLDSSQPRLIPTEGMEDGRSIPAQPFPLKINNGDPETLRVEATTVAKDIRWRLDIPWYSGSDSGTYSVGVEGAPLTTYGTARVGTAYASYRDGSGWQKVYPG